MVALTALWIPILVSAAVVFVGSAVAWMALPHHKKDWQGVPDEDGFLNAVRTGDIKPGQYMFPFCQDPSALKDPEKKKRYDAGPHGVLTVWPGAPTMGPKLGMTFVFYLLVSLLVAYVGRLAIDPGTESDFLNVFRVTGTVAVIAYCLGFIPNAIWFGKPCRAVMMDLVDGVVYGLLTGAVFGWLWPAQDAGTLVPGLG